MSCYNWEAGTIQLPKSQFAKIRKQFINDYNDIKEREFEACKRLRQYALDKAKGKRGFDFHQEMFDNAKRFGVSDESVYAMINGTKRPRAMTRKAIGFANSKTMSFSLDGEGSVSFDKERKTISYDVWENNRAVERARETAVGRLFFNTMRKVNWTRGSGGTLYGNDEYNKHESYGGSGGGNYITEQFGKNVDNRRDLW